MATLRKRAGKWQARIQRIGIRPKAKPSIANKMQKSGLEKSSRF